MEIQSYEIFFIDSRSAAAPAQISGKQTLFLIHGFPTSSIDYRDCLPILHTKFERIILFDMPGFGFSSKPANFTYTLSEQAEFAFHVLNRLDVQDCSVLSHDMGDSVLTEMIRRISNEMQPKNFAKFHSIVFTNGGMKVEFANLRLSQILLRNSLISKFVPFLQEVKFGELFFHKQIMR